MLSCQCNAMGGRGNCCKGDRAKLGVSSAMLDSDNHDSMSEQMQNYVKDICAVTNKMIGENKLPPSGELITTAKPTAAPTVWPSISTLPSIRPSISTSPSVQPTLSIRPTSSPTSGVTVEIPTQCLNLLLTSRNPYQKLKKDNYFFFTYGMANKLCTVNNITSYLRPATDREQVRVRHAVASS